MGNYRENFFPVYTPLDAKTFTIGPPWGLVLLHMYGERFPRHERLDIGVELKEGL